MADCFPQDYVFRGAVVTYNATVPSQSDPWWGGVVSAVSAALWQKAANAVKAGAQAHYGVQASEVNKDSGSLFYRLSVEGDMRSINDVKSTMDAAVKNAGFKLMASAVRFINNPRRDGCGSPTSGPGKVYPPASGNVDTSQPPGVIETTTDAWFGGIAKQIGLTSQTTALLVLGVSALLLFSLIGGRR